MDLGSFGLLGGKETVQYMQMRIEMSQGFRAYYCLKCNKEETNHRTGVCKNCRMILCEQCKKLFTAKSLETKLCSACAMEKKRLKKTRGDQGMYV